MYTNAAGQRVQTLVDGEVGRPSIDSMLNQASGMAQELTSSAVRQAATAAYARDSAQSTSNLYASGAGDVRGPFYSTSSRVTGSLAGSLGSGLAIKQITN